MSFNLKEPSTFINIKLTDTGRRMMASGNFHMDKAVLLDREIDYSVDDSGYYNIFDNRVMNPSEYHPDASPFNLDSTPAYNLSNQSLTTQKLIVTALTSYLGFFSGSPGSWSLDITMARGKNHITYATNATNMSQGTNMLILDNSGGSLFPVENDLIFIPWVHDTSLNYMTSNQVVPLISPVLCCWYKVLSTDTSTATVFLDRPINGSGKASQTTCFIYPDNAIESYYSSGATQVVKSWNLNIVRTKNIIGTNTSVSGHCNYTRYGSLQYNGTKKYFGFENETPAVGFIHYTNENTGNTYGEQLIEGSFEMHLPMIMWHHNNHANSSGTTWGVSFYDYYGQTQYDAITKTSFRDLKDSDTASGLTVGRVYHKLKLVVITDQELLTALTYKSNRNYTLPDFNVSLVNKPKIPLLNSQASGLCKSGYTYFVSYVPATTGYSNSVTALSYGHPPVLPCGYIKKIDGQMDSDGNPNYLQIDFPNQNSFPYMRGPQSYNAYTSIGGWNAWTVQILVNEQLSELNYDISNVPSDGWLKVSDLTLGGNGIYDRSNYSDSTINPNKLNSYNFIISREDVTSGSTYTLPSSIAYAMDDLTFGDEYILHGTIRSGILSTSYKSTITVTAKNPELNSSDNSTYDKQLHSEVYVTEVAILDSLNQVVAVGKPTYPIRKLAGKYLGFKLEVDF